MSRLYMIALIFNQGVYIIEASTRVKGRISMSERVKYATKIDKDLRDQLLKLSEITRIPQSKLLDEAIEDLLKKHQFEQINASLHK